MGLLESSLSHINISHSEGRVKLLFGRFFPFFFQ